MFTGGGIRRVTSPGVVIAASSRGVGLRRSRFTPLSSGPRAWPCGTAPAGPRHSPASPRAPRPRPLPYPLHLSARRAHPSGRCGRRSGKPLAPAGRPLRCPTPRRSARTPHVARLEILTAPLAITLRAVLIDPVYQRRALRFSFRLLAMLAEQLRPGLVGTADLRALEGGHCPRSRGIYWRVEEQLAGVL